MLRSYKYRIYPTDAQEETLNELLWMACWVYNHALAYRRKRWNESRASVSYYDQCKILSAWRNEDADNNPLQLINVGAARSALRRLDTAYREFIKGKRGRPRFRQSRRYDSISYPYNDGTRITENRVYFQNVGTVRVRWHRPLPEGKPKQIILLRRPSGWYIVIQIDMPACIPSIPYGEPVGIDVGLYHALALSDGTIIDSPAYLKQSLAHLRVLQRTVARRKKGSKRWWKAVEQVQKLQEHIANQRRDWWHKVTRWLVDNYSVVALENLSLQFMLQNGNMSRAAHDVSIGVFRDLLNYKAIEAGVEVVMVNPAYTSQICSACGCIVKKTLSERVHCCPECGFTTDRDVNAALNILSRSGHDRQALTQVVAPCVA